MNEKLVGEVPKGIPGSMRLLVDFARYCEIKRDCPHLCIDENGAPRCHHPDFDGACRFEECPIMKTGGRE